jgi:peptide/nickel transport system substrate-binding protein
LLFCLASLFFVSCGDNSSASKGHPLPASALISKCEPGVPGGELTLAMPERPGTFNPLLVNDSAADLVARLLFESLVTLDWATQEATPALAESWSVAPDSRTWTFKLRQGVRWSDGYPFTADDIAFTWNAVMLDPQVNRISYDIFHPNGKAFEVAKVDDFTVRVTTPEVFAPFLEFFGTVAILPRHRLEASIREHRFLTAYDTNTPPEAIIGSGPFRVKEVKAGFTLMERNPEFWVKDSKGQRLPYFERVRLVASGDPGSDVELFLTGKSDVFEKVRPEMYYRFAGVAKQAHFKLIDLGVGPDREIFWFNQNTNVNRSGEPLVNPAKLKWFRDRKFRQAVSLAIDRERIAKEAYGGRALPAFAFISTENPKWANTNIVAPPRDVARAKALLAEIGISDKTGSGIATDTAGITTLAPGQNKPVPGTPVEITLISNMENPSRAKACEIIVENLKDIGIKLFYRPLPFSATQQKIDGTFDYEAALIGLGGTAIDPESQRNVLKSSEVLHQWFPLQRTPSTDWEARIDALMDAQLRTLDFATRKKAFDEVQALLAEEMPMIFTVSPIACSAVRDNLANLRPAVMTPYRLTWNIEELYFRK